MAGGRREGGEGGQARRERRGAGHVCAPSLACTLSPSLVPFLLSPRCQRPAPARLRASHTGYFGQGSTREIARPLVRSRSRGTLGKKKNGNKDACPNCLPVRYSCMMLTETRPCHVQTSSQYGPRRTLKRRPLGASSYPVPRNVVWSIAIYGKVPLLQERRLFSVAAPRSSNENAGPKVPSADWPAWLLGK